MSEKNHFYITTTLPYVNSDPHIGHAVEMVRADIVARYKRLIGEKVFFNTGTDEHGQKVYTKALSLRRDPKEYVDEYAERFKFLKEKLNLSYDSFIRTTDEKHIRAAEEFWKQCFDKGYIYKKKYKGLYCVSDELFVAEKDMINGRCPNHPDKELVTLEEENYFFKFSAFQEKLLDLYQKKPDFIIPSSRLKEIRTFVERGIEDFSISRLKEKMPWGIEVPGDPQHVMYVWFDALVNYIAAIGWPDDMGKFNTWWPVIQYAGKDNLRQQAAMWQAMLFSVGLPPSQRIVIDGFVLSDGGRKMSKSVGNVVSPIDIVAQYGTDALRYYIARELHPFEDSEFTEKKFKEAYNANLANGLGNLVSRVMKLSEDYDVKILPYKVKTEPHMLKAMDTFKFNDAMEFIWQKVQSADRRMTKEEPFKVVKTDPVMGKAIIQTLVLEVREIGIMLQPFMPETAKKIESLIKENRMPEKPLFPRI